MKPGRELDALVAEKVMGYEKMLVPKDSLPHIGGPGLRWPRQDGWLYLESGYPRFFEGHCNDIYVDPGGSHVGQVPNYSTDIAAAWEVVEKLCEVRENGVFPRCVLQFVSPYGWSCFFEYGDVLNREHRAAAAATAPLAICLAALAAVGFHEQED